MKNILFAITLFLSSILSAGCETSTMVNGQEAQCIGVFDDEDPEYNYGVSVLNLFSAVLFSASVVIPVVVAATVIKCPKTRKNIHRGA